MLILNIIHILLINNLLQIIKSKNMFIKFIQSKNICSLFLEVQNTI